MGETHRTEFCRRVGKGPDFAEALTLVMDELDDALTDLESSLKKGDGPVPLNDDGELVISPLTAEDIPSEAEDLHAELERMLPNVPITSLLVNTDRHTGFPDCSAHAGGKQTRSPQLKRNLIACLIGLPTNLGLRTGRPRPAESRTTCRRVRRSGTSVRRRCARRTPAWCGVSPRSRRTGLVPDRRDECGDLLHTEYMGLAVDELRKAGREVDAEVLPRGFCSCSSKVARLFVDHDHRPSGILTPVGWILPGPMRFGMPRWRGVPRSLCGRR
ncbi:hypothetical protein ACFTXM_41365 [Streptomyces sp. NPDC056930]|uniref:hypothetical protein n=1 Tax=Streptomyces sp. NPDC056930 TaxID=3345967 RepID=UPI00363E3061